MTPFPSFALRLPAQVRFGRGAAVEAAPEMARFGQRLVLVHGSSPARAAPLRAALEAEGCSIDTFSCDREPTLDMLVAAIDRLRPLAPAAVVAVGGGAVLDMGKALAALLPSTGASPLDHLEVVGQGRPLTVAPLPCIALPTTAGTGSEATKNAVIGVPEHARKVSLRDDRMVPRLAIVDPALMDGTPKPQTLASGMDAVVQVIEPYLSSRANPFTDALVRPAIAAGLEALVTLMEDGEDPDARDALAFTAHVSGIALANAGLGAVHGIAGVLGGETGIAHGVICARLLPEVLDALRTAEAPDETQRRLHEVRSMLDSTIPGGIANLHPWMSQHGLPALDPISSDGIARIASASEKSSSMAASPVRFDTETLSGILTRSISADRSSGQREVTVE